MFITEPMSTITRQRIFIIKSSIPAVKPRLIPIFRVAVMTGMRKIDFFPFFLIDTPPSSVLGPSVNLVRRFK